MHKLKSYGWEIGLRIDWNNISEFSNWFKFFIKLDEERIMCSRDWIRQRF